MSILDTNPANYMGGTWVSWGSGRVPVGVDTNDNNFDTVEETGGSTSESYTPTGSVAGHTLTVQQIPSHNHGGYTGYDADVNVFKVSSGSGNPQFVSGSYNFNVGTMKHRHTVSSQGGGQSHNHGFTGTAATISHLQPYITCYMFKRTA